MARDKKENIRKLCDWFINSGVMDPSDGSWGVAERIVLTENNPSTEKIYQHFPAWTPYASYSIIEQRRADCNFQTALFLSIAADILQDAKLDDIAQKILAFLYYRSGLLSRNITDEWCGCWFWSHVKRVRWLDDNGWICAIQIWLSEMYPDLERKYEMRNWALKLANTLDSAFNSHFGKDQFSPIEPWCGVWKLPHWGSLVCMALTVAYSRQPCHKYQKIVLKYHRYLLENKNLFNTSELAYLLIGATFAATIFKNEIYYELSSFATDKLVNSIDEDYGNIPSQHDEAPIGNHLVDTIYTVNWAVLGLQNYKTLTGVTKYDPVLNKMIERLCEIQDNSSYPHLKGCWRGMFDLESNSWGGGDSYEGGANSIYTGWTNAPIGLALCFQKIDSSLLGFGLSQKLMGDNGRGTHQSRRQLNRNSL